MAEVNAAAAGMSSASTDHAGKYFNIPLRGRNRALAQTVKMWRKV